MMIHLRKTAGKLKLTDVRQVIHLAEQYEETSSGRNGWRFSFVICE